MWRRPLYGLILGLLSFAAAATDWIVAVDSAVHGEGTLDAPLRTLFEACRRAQPGDTVFIRGGVYRETLAPVRSGTAERPITFTRYGAEPVVIDASGRNQGVMLWNVSHIVVRGLEVRNAERIGIHIHHHDDVPPQGSDHNLIEQNLVYANHSHGIYVGGNFNRVINNTVFENGVQALDGNGHGIYLLGSDNLVANNKVHHNRRLGIRLAGQRQQVLNNWIEANNEDGIGVWVDYPHRGEDLRFEGNQLLANLGHGIYISGQGNGYKPARVWVRGNTIQADGKAGIVLRGGVEQVELSDNRLSGRFDHFLHIDNLSSAKVSSDRNLFEGSGPFFFADRDYPDLNAYQRASGLDKSSHYRP